MQDSRIRPIDAARGTAMLFVFLSHFGYVYATQNNQMPLLMVTAHVGMVASPAFMLISGIVLGFLYRTKKATFADIRAKLMDRGVFLLTIGHVLIFAATIPTAGGIRPALTWAFITDAIGLAIILGPLLMTRLRTGQRAMLAVTVYALGWVLVLFWHPDIWLLGVLKELLFGHLHEDYRVFAVNFPFVPWFALYIIGTCLGEKIGIYHIHTDGLPILSYILTVAVISGVLAVFLRIGYEVTQRLALTSASEAIFHSLASPFQKLPPSPAYFLFYGGAGLAILYVLFALEKRGLANGFIVAMSIMGQTSLFVFVLQYYVYYTVLHILGLPFTPLWPLYFVLSVVLMGLASRFWYDRNYNRFITVKHLSRLITGVVARPILWYEKKLQSVHRG